MEDIFAFDNIEFNSDNPKMTSVEFVEKTKKMLNEIMNEYSSAHSWRLITEEEFKVTPCDSCKGESEFEFCGKKVNCVQDRERGDCGERVFDNEGFLEFIEQEIMFGASPFIELMTCDIVEPLPNTTSVF